MTIFAHPEIIDGIKQYNVAVVKNGFDLLTEIIPNDDEKSKDLDLVVLNDVNFDAIELKKCILKLDSFPEYNDEFDKKFMNLMDSFATLKGWLRTRWLDFGSISIDNGSAGRRIRDPRGKYCYCFRKLDKYVACDFCGKWYHSSCQSILYKDVVPQGKKWKCFTCIKNKRKVPKKNISYNFGDNNNTNKKRKKR